MHLDADAARVLCGAYFSVSIPADFNTFFIHLDRVAFDTGLNGFT